MQLFLFHFIPVFIFIFSFHKTAAKFYGKDRVWTSSKFHFLEMLLRTFLMLLSGQEERHKLSQTLKKEEVPTR